MSDPLEVIVLNPAYWAGRAPQLAQLLKGAAERGAAGPIGDPLGVAPNPETMLTVADPMYWSANFAELQDVLADATGGGLLPDRAGQDLPPEQRHPPRRNA
jgi:hypothetical protein